MVLICARFGEFSGLRGGRAILEMSFRAAIRMGIDLRDSMFSAHGGSWCFGVFPVLQYGLMIV